MVGAGRRYEVRGLLGEGAFGAVYLARAVGGGIQREVAIKVLHRDRASNPALVGRLRDEARMLALIRHRAIIRVDDLIELDGDWSIVMEYVEGCDVAALLGPGALPPSVALAIAEEVANALHAACHQPGPDGRPLRLIHRDIKPGNVRITAQGEVKLLDFGVARAEFAEREAGTTQTGFGTLTYMAPERFEGKDSHASDIYALGVFLFEMLTGVTPGKTAADRDRQPPGSRYAEHWAVLREVSPDLEALVAQMMAYEPEHRPVARDCARALSDRRGALRGEHIEDWAGRTVPDLLRAGGGAPRPNDRTGTILTERSRVPAAERERSTVRVLPWLAGGVASVLLFGLVVVAAGGATWWALSPAEVPAPVVAAPVPEVVVKPIATKEPVEVAPLSAPPKTAPARARLTTSGPAETVAAAVPVAKAAVPPAIAFAPPASTSGRLRLDGDAVQVTLAGQGGRVSAGSVPAGSYTAEVTFASGTSVTIRNITVSPDRVTVLTCKADFGNCRVAQE
ncbi:MAG: protein kinase [Pseudomonadota bacterium]|nr:protein kinase [Pseudomonadota bacterium]